MESAVSDLYTVAGDEHLVRHPRMPSSRLSVDAHICTPRFEVNVRTLRLNDPLDAYFRPLDGYLDMSLDEYSHGRYGAFRGETGHTGFAPLGSSVFVPAGQTFHVRGAPMRRRAVCCMFADECTVCGGRGSERAVIVSRDPRRSASLASSAVGSAISCRSTISRPRCARSMRIRRPSAFFPRR
ncbi:hypothetical protein [Paraburkholderia dinghuensis]|uniref:hypothetical protein n=1 Tax=Paraburkholderia dinghuensis TaxID=2305225 RepID=UPI001C87B139|nr:hypothetical protein [Paraburkholderia dinghuensis]